MAEKAKIMFGAARRLCVSPYERTSSLLLALLISLGVAVCVLLAVWWTNRMFVARVAVPVELTNIGWEEGEGEGGGDGRPSGGSQLDDPAEQIAPGTDETPKEVQENLTAITEATVERAAQFDDQLDDPALVPRRRRGDFGTGGGTWGGTGEGRGLGHGPGKPGLPRRWEVHFMEGNTLDVYARQLDFFGIEMGALLPDNKVIYVFNLSKPKPDVREGAAVDEKRYYLTWRGPGDLQRADRELLTRAGVDVGDRIILKFLPKAVEEQLAALEWARAGSPPKKVRKTRFGIQSAGNGYSFYVLEQTYR